MDGKPFVLFDFDGVIADSFDMASALANRRCKHLTTERYRSAFEGNIYDALAKGLKDGKRPDHGLGCEHDLDWWTEYAKTFPSVQPFADILPAIERLAAEYRLAIVTSGRRTYIEPFLATHALAGRFTDILDYDVHTHKTKKIEIMFERYAIQAPDCVFITDTLGDIREAAHHAIGSIACAWGFHSHETLQKGIPFRIIDEPAQLPDAVNEYFAR